MSSLTETMRSTSGSSGDGVAILSGWLDECDTVLIGAGAGLSTAAGHEYGGSRFRDNFPDFIARYGYDNMYAATFQRYESPEEHWAYWSRHIMINRYETEENDTYDMLLDLVDGRDYFVITTNVDHCFQRHGFDKKRLYYTQGDYGLWQCSGPCHQATYDNEERVRRMAAEQRDMKVPSELVPYCPRCGRPMTMNLRTDDTFVQDKGWYEAADRYRRFCRVALSADTLFLELGVGYNTPGIIKFPFWKMAMTNPRSRYASVSMGSCQYPPQLEGRALGLDMDIRAVLTGLTDGRDRGKAHNREDRFDARNHRPPAVPRGDHAAAHQRQMGSPHPEGPHDGHQEVQRAHEVGHRGVPEGADREAPPHGGERAGRQGGLP